LAKPIDPQKLKEALQKVMDGKLDNPVQLAEPASDYTQIQENEVKLSVDSLAAASAMDLEGGTKDNRVDAAPIRDMLLDGDTMAITIDDVESDSFSDAITRGLELE